MGSLFYSIHHVHVLLPLLYCFDDHNFEIWNSDIRLVPRSAGSCPGQKGSAKTLSHAGCPDLFSVLTFFCLLRIFSVYLQILGLFHSLEKWWWCFDRVHIECIDCCWWHKHHMNIYFSNPWEYTFFHIFLSSLMSFIHTLEFLEYRYFPLWLGLFLIIWRFICFLNFIS